jgi:Concanavalin A-like lectin/glucanases superfamily/Chaperone of endosialidase/Repeat of unknown function (DUF5907)
MSLTITRPTIPVPLPLTRGGTEATTPAGARTQLGLGDLAVLDTLPTSGLDNGAVTYAKIQNVSGPPRVLGRYGAGAGVVQELTLGSGLTVDGAGVITAAGGGGGSTTLLGLTDVPDSYAGQAGKVLAVNPGETGTEFVTPVAGGGAPTDADYITSTVNATLSAERVLTDTATITWDRTTAGQIKANVSGGGYTDEQAQDAIGAMLVDTATIDLTYTDATPSLSATVNDASITEAKLGLSDVTTKDASTTAHGLLRKLSGTATQYLDGSGAWTTPAGAASYWTRNAGTGLSAGTGLLAFWRMEEASGDRVDSVSGLALVPQGPVAQITSAAGRHGQAVKLNGTAGTYLSCPHATQISAGGNQSFTFAFWFLLDAALATNTGLICKGQLTAATMEYEILYSGTLLYSRMGNGSTSASATVTAPTATATWHFLVSWFDQSTLTMYIQVNNGTPGSGANTFGSYTASHGLDIGHRDDAVGTTMNGRIDNFMFWKRTLTTQERTDLWNSGNGVDYLTLVGTGPALVPSTPTDALALTSTRLTTERLEVDGGIKLGTTTGTTDGTLRWTGTDFEGRKAGAWVSMTGAYTDEQAQDAIGAMLVDTATIDLTYTDATPSLTASVIAGSIGTTQLANDAVTYAKLQNVTDARLLGRSAGSAGDAQELTVGTGLSLAAGVLSNTVSAGQPLDATLTALAGLATGADQLPYATGTDTFAQTTLTTFARTLLDDTTQAAMRTTLALTPGTDVQAQDAELQAIAGLTSAADRLPYFTGAGTAALATFTAFARTLLDDVDAATMRGTLGAAASASTQPLDATLTALAGLATGADTLPYFTGTDTASQTPLTAAGRTLVGGADAAAQRGALGLGTLAQQGANAVAITGGVISIGGHTPTGVLDVQTSVQASDVTNFYPGMRLWPVAPSGATAVQCIRIEPLTGAGVAGTDFRGLVIMDPPAGTVNARGLDLSISAAPNRWNIYASGTAPNYFAGEVYAMYGIGVGVAATPDAWLTVQYDRLVHGILLKPTVDTGVGVTMLFRNAAGSTVGSINASATATAYNTSSDVRLKHAIAPLTAALERVRALRPVSFRWNADDSSGVGFLAHELQQTIHEAVAGEPDAVNDDGSVKPQQVDHSKIVPWLTSAVQALLGRVETLEAHVAAIQA